MNGGAAPGLIVVPAQETMFTSCVAKLLPVVQSAPRGSGVRFETDHVTLVAKRNAAVRRLLERPEWKWLLTVDSDMEPPADTLTRLLRTGKDVVGALCFQRKPPYMAVLHTLGDDRTFAIDGSLAEVEAVGTGCLLVRRAVFEAVEPPWFVVDENDVREDINFCAAARRAGYRVWVDSGLIVGHTHPMAVTATFPPR